MVNGLTARTIISFHQTLHSISGSDFWISGDEDDVVQIKPLPFSPINTSINLNRHPEDILSNFCFDN